MTIEGFRYPLMHVNSAPRSRTKAPWSRCRDLSWSVIRPLPRTWG